MTAFSDYAENLVLKWLFTADLAPRPASWYLGLHTQDPTESGSAGELSGNGYARVAVTLTINGNEASNAAQILVGPATGMNWGTITHISVWDSQTGGNCIAKGPLEAPIAINVGDSLTIAPGSFDLSLN